MNEDDFQVIISSGGIHGQPIFFRQEKSEFVILSLFRAQCKERRRSRPMRPEPDPALAPAPAPAPVYFTGHLSSALLSYGL